MFAETYYYLTIPLMIIIHAGFPGLRAGSVTAEERSGLWREGAIMFFLLGFVPGYVVSLILKMLGLLRVGEEAEVAGLDISKVPVAAYPEGIGASGMPAQ